MTGASLKLIAFGRASTPQGGGRAQPTVPVLELAADGRESTKITAGARATSWSRRPYPFIRGSACGDLPSAAISVDLADLGL